MLVTAFEPKRQGSDEVMRPEDWRLWWLTLVVEPSLNGMPCALCVCSSVESDGWSIGPKLNWSAKCSLWSVMNESIIATNLHQRLQSNIIEAVMICWRSQGSRIKSSIKHRPKWSWSGLMFELKCQLWSIVAVFQRIQIYGPRLKSNAIEGNVDLKSLKVRGWIEVNHPNNTMWKSLVRRSKKAQVNYQVWSAITISHGVISVCWLKSKYNGRYSWSEVPRSKAEDRSVDRLSSNHNALEIFKYHHEDWRVAITAIKPSSVAAMKWNKFGLQFSLGSHQQADDQRYLPI